VAVIGLNVLAIMPRVTGWDLVSTDISPQGAFDAFHEVNPSKNGTHRVSQDRLEQVSQNSPNPEKGPDSEPWFVALWRLSTGDSAGERSFCTSDSF
jgi:hypothetical protein